MNQSKISGKICKLCDIRNPADDDDDDEDFTATRVRWVFVDNQDSDANAGRYEVTKGVGEVVQELHDMLVL